MLKTQVCSDSCCWPLKTVIGFFSVAVESQLLLTWDPHKVECWSRRVSAGCWFRQCLCYVYIPDYFSVASGGRLRNGCVWISKALATFTTDLLWWYELRMMTRFSKRLITFYIFKLRREENVTFLNHRLRTIFAVSPSDLTRSMVQTPLRRTAFNWKLKASNLSVETGK